MIVEDFGVELKHLKICFFSINERNKLTLILIVYLKIFQCDQ